MPPYVPPSEHSNEYYEENYDYYEMREDKPVKKLDDVLKIMMMALISTQSTFLSVPHQPSDAFLTLELIVTSSPNPAFFLQHQLQSMGSQAPYLPTKQ